MRAWALPEPLPCAPTPSGWRGWAEHGTAQPAQGSR